MTIIGDEIIHDALRHRVIAGAGEHPDAMIGQVPGAVDEATPGVPIRYRDQLIHIGGTLPEASERNAAAGRCRGHETALRAVIWSACDDPGATQYGGEGNVELHLHVSAGRHTGDRSLIDVHVVALEAYHLG